MNIDIYWKLQEVAKAETLITYGEVAPLAGLDMANDADRSTMSALLDEINKYEAGHERPMLSALVVLADAKTPGQGFWVCARDLGRLTSTDRWKEVEFWANEVKEGHRHWRSLA